MVKIFRVVMERFRVVVEGLRERGSKEKYSRPNWYDWNG